MVWTVLLTSPRPSITHSIGHHGRAIRLSFKWAKKWWLRIYIQLMGQIQGQWAHRKQVLVAPSVPVRYIHMNKSSLKSPSSLLQTRWEAVTSTECPTPPQPLQIILPIPNSHPLKPTQTYTKSNNLLHRLTISTQNLPFYVPVKVYQKWTIDDISSIF